MLYINSNSLNTFFLYVNFLQRVKIVWNYRKKFNVTGLCARLVLHDR